MTELNISTKRAQGFITSYNNSIITDIKESYITPSIAKQTAIIDCLSCMIENNGFAKKIISYNKEFFTFAFLFNKDYIELTCDLCIITYANKYIIRGVRYFEYSNGNYKLDP